jgi:hypothetical protein
MSASYHYVADTKLGTTTWVSKLDTTVFLFSHRSTRFWNSKHCHDHLLLFVSFVTIKTYMFSTARNSRFSRFTIPVILMIPILHSQTPKLWETSKTIDNLEFLVKCWSVATSISIRSTSLHILSQSVLSNNVRNGH